MTKRTSFLTAVLWTIAIAVSLSVSAIILEKLLFALHVDFQLIRLGAGFGAAIVALLVTVALEKRIGGESYWQAIQALGLKTGTSRQFFWAIIGTLPILIAYLIIFFGLGRSPELIPQAPLFLLKLLLAQGLIEEVVFRGFIYRRLRNQRSFVQAAALSGVLFAVVHLVNLTKGINAEVISAVGISMAFAMILSFPLAMLFEVGGGSILGGALFHLAIDSINCFREAGSSGPGSAPTMPIYLGAILVSAVIVTLFAHRRIPKRQS